MLQVVAIKGLKSTIASALIIVIFYEIFFFPSIFSFHAHDFLTKYP